MKRGSDIGRPYRGPIVIMYMWSQSFFHIQEVILNKCFLQVIMCREMLSSSYEFVLVGYKCREEKMGVTPLAKYFC